MIEIRSISKSFGPDLKPILRDVSFEVRDGEFVTLLGPSGCGKTTLLRIVAGLEAPSSGSVRMEGRDVTDLSPRDRDIAFVFQSYALYPHMSVEENVGVGLKLHGTPKPEVRKRVEEAARTLGIHELLGRRPASLSGGQRQRVALARAMVRRPKAFLLDEPLSNLDAVLRDKTRGELKMLFKTIGGTVLYVTHDQVEAMTLSDRVVVLQGGEIQQMGAPSEIYSQPANLFVAGFLGSPPMNVVTPEEASALGLGDGGREKTLCGFRPEDVAYFPGKSDGCRKAFVVVVEPTGAQTILTLRLEGVVFRIVTGSKVGPLDEAWVRLPSREDLHLFDKSTGLRLPSVRGE